MTSLEKVKALLDEFEPPLANQLQTYLMALTEKLNVLGALDDEILALMTEEHIEDEIKELPSLFAKYPSPVSMFS